MPISENQSDVTVRDDSRSLEDGWIQILLVDEINVSLLPTSTTTIIMPITYPTFSGRQGMAIVRFFLIFPCWPSTERGCWYRSKKLALVGGTSLLSYQMTRGIDGRVKEKESQRGFAAAQHSEFWRIGTLGTTAKFLLQKNWLKVMNSFIWRLRPALHQGLQKMPMLKAARCLRRNGCDRECELQSFIYKTILHVRLWTTCCTHYHIQPWKGAILDSKNDLAHHVTWRVNMISDLAYKVRVMVLQC